MINYEWRTKASQQLGVELINWQQLGGGDFAQSWRATVKSCNTGVSAAVGGTQVSPAITADSGHVDSSELIGSSGLIAQDREAFLQVGHPVFIKTHASPPPRHFTTEAVGLGWMRDTGTLSIPAVLAVSDELHFLALQWIDEGHRTAASEISFGRQLAGLHTARCTSFGRLDQRCTGSLGIPNEPGSTWAGFYANQRLLPLARIAAQRNSLSATCIRNIERVAARLDEFGANDESPSLLHGDLWAGNRLMDNGANNWLIDPACHGGHREFDLAMMRLFGGYDEACFAAYAEAYPLAAGWQDRIQLHQLAPLIVHAIKFGHAYVGPTEEALSRYL